MPYRVFLSNGTAIDLDDNYYRALKQALDDSTEEERFLVLDDDSFINISHITNSIKIKHTPGEIVKAPDPDTVRKEEERINELKTRDLDSTLKTIKQEELNDKD